MIYVILGTTASGKTNVAIDLARKFNMPIIGADAYQIYKELEKGSAAPTEEELQGVKTYFIKDHTIKNPVNIKLYQDECRKILNEQIKKGQDVIICGGSFLYVKASLFSYEFPEENDDTIKKELDLLSNEELYARLKSLNAEVASELHMNNRKRVARAIINLMNEHKRTESNDRLLYPAVFYAIDIDREDNIKNINLRTEKMFEEGFVDEVKELIKDERNLTTAFEAIGYKQIKEGLELGQSIEDMKTIVNIKTRQYAKRQKTFLKHQFENINWMKKEDIFKSIENDILFRQRTKSSLSIEKYNSIESKKILVAGAGGVGCAAIESLIRLGINDLTVVDFDYVSPSNLNRQTIYSSNDLNRKKVDVVKEYAKKINPLIKMSTVDAKVDENFCKGLNEKYDFIFDCIDDVSAKVSLIIYAKENKIPLIVCCGTAKKQDSSQVRCGFLSDTGDGLAKAIKKRLKEKNISFNDVFSVYSIEQSIKNNESFLPSMPTVPLAAGLAMV